MTTFFMLLQSVCCHLESTIFLNFFESFFLLLRIVAWLDEKKLLCLIKDPLKKSVFPSGSTDEPSEWLNSSLNNKENHLQM